jgi:transcriptional regulator with XRE-family HTH domain
MKNLPQKIQNLMIQKNIGATDIEKKTGLNKNTVYSIVAGNSKSPSAHTLQLIAKALDVSLESILIDEEETLISISTLSNQQMKIFADVTSTTINIIIEKELNFPLNKLIDLIKEVYQYSLKANPICVDIRFIDWLLDKYKN